MGRFPRRPTGGRPGPVRRVLMRNAAAGVEGAREELMRANQLAEAGNYSEAGEAFTRMSLLAEQHNFPGRAATLAARAALVYLQGGDVEGALASARRAMQVSASMGNVQRIAGWGHRFLSELDQRDYTAQASSFRMEVDLVLRRFGVSMAEVAQEPQSRGQLPARCLACLGPVRSDEVDWIDQGSASCAYCGSTLQAS
jgi:hypothetical protein